MDVYIGLGSNQGDRRLHLSGAVRTLEAQATLSLEGCSSLYESPPLDPSGDEDQPDYLNAVARVTTTLLPLDLLILLQRIEREAGRAPNSHGLSRTLDLDLLLYGDEILRGPQLTLPHPGLAKRRFVLDPLNEMAPDLVPPGLGRRVRDLAIQPGILAQKIVTVGSSGWWREVVR